MLLSSNGERYLMTAPVALVYGDNDEKCAICVYRYTSIQKVRDNYEKSEFGLPVVDRVTPIADDSYSRHGVIISKSIPETKLPQIITNREVPITFLQMDSLIQNWEKVKRFSNKEIFIIGGGEIYKQLLPYCDRVYVTLIEKSHDNVDTYFPNLNKDPEWEVSTCTELRDYGNIPYAFLTYDRIS
jgi:dihydrofolate reductase